MKNAQVVSRAAGGGRAAYRVSTRARRVGILPCRSRSFVGLGGILRMTVGNTGRGPVSSASRAGHFDRLGASPLDDSGGSSGI